VSSACSGTSDSVPPRRADAAAGLPVTALAGGGAVDEPGLLAAAARLGAASVPGWSRAEQRLAAAGRPGSPAEAAALAAVREQVRAGGDPLGEAFCALRGPVRRRGLGQTFTPAPVIDSMIAWAAASGCRPARVVDPGCGSARFLLAAGRRWPDAELVGVEIDPAAAILGRASLAMAGLAARSRVVLGDYRSARLPRAGGPTLYLGNPPYVRHHHIAAGWKDWLRRAAAEQGLPASALAGLHAHFFLATARRAVPGDTGVLITAAEWLDVNYGSLVRGLLLGSLGGRALHLIEPASPVFADAAATSVIACFQPGTAARTVRLRRVASASQLGRLGGGRAVPAPVLRAAARWGPLLRAARPARPPAGHVELGELCRVHRGQVTGANAVWITAGRHPLIPGRFQVPAVTQGRELLRAGQALPAGVALRLVIDLPADLAQLSEAEREPVARFLRWAASAGAAGGYVARHRTPWWRVRLGPPAPILASYMARRPPAFVRNLAAARHLNIAHGLYPRDPLAAPLLDALAAALAGSVTTGQGRVYAGGLVKFEPREMERLPVPGPVLLAALAAGGPSDRAGP